MTNLGRRLCLFLFLPLVIFPLGCASLWKKPVETSVDERLSQFPAQKDWPVQRRVQVAFREGMIPFVEAESDDDCAFAIGVVHAYLRLGQMELLRRGSAGRLSESAGALGTSKIDEFIRRLDLGRAAEKSLQLMSQSDRRWLGRYVQGINFFLKTTNELPYEFSFLNWQKEEWSEADIFRISRLAGSDVNWGVLLGLLEIKDQPGADRIWQSVLAGAQSSIPSLGSSDQSGLNQFFLKAARTGSNSVVVGPKKSKTGAALLASDPHLGVFVPNLWMLMGYRCPSYEVLGFMLPGVPTVTLGRNSHSAWGGTYMRATSSHLFAVKPNQITAERTETIRRRNWFSKSVTIKESVHGPIVFEGKENEKGEDTMVALSWVGHQPSNEIGAFLAVNRAKSFTEFRAAFQNYGVSGLNMTYADTKGDIGLVPAVGQPVLAKPEYEKLIKSADNSVQRVRSVQELPFGINPPEGFLVSANNQPIKTQPPLAYSSGENDRVRRWQSLLRQKELLTAQDLMRMQQDVFSEDSLQLGRLYVDALQPFPEQDREILTRLQAWDGAYTVDSQGAPIFEILTYQLAQDLVKKQFSSKEVQRRFLGRDTWRVWVYEQLSQLKQEDRRLQLLSAIDKARSSLNQSGDWGSQHPQRVQTPLGLLPVLGARFRFGEFPSPGSGTTIYKASFTPSLEETPVIFGAQSRHVSDLSNPDENYFVLLGGNDGWLITENLTNQVELWRRGEFLRIPLSKDRVAEDFNLKTFVIKPAQAKAEK